MAVIRRESVEQFESLSERVEAVLRRRLLAGEYPVWSRLVERRLAEELGVSRTPVKEALRRLEREEIVVASPDGVYRPRPPDLARLHDYYEVRLNLERFSIQLASVNGSRTELRAIQQEWRRLEKQYGTDESEHPDFVYMDESFHVGLARAGGNEALVTILEDINDRIRVIRVHDFYIPGRVAETIMEHLTIIDALLDGDADAATNRLTEHIRDSAGLVEDRAMRALAKMTAQQSPIRSVAAVDTLADHDTHPAATDGRQRDPPLEAPLEASSWPT